MNAPTAKPQPPPRSFARRWSRRVGLGSLLLALAGGALLFWLLATVGGRDTLLARIVGMLPPGSLSWERAEGTVVGPLVLHGLRYSHDGVEFTARRVLLDPDVLPVLGRRLQLDALEVDGARLSLPADEDEPFELPRWPESLPKLELPLDIRSARVAVNGFDVVKGGEPLVSITRVDASALHLVRGGFSVDRLVLASDRGALQLKGAYAPTDNYRSEFDGTVTLPAVPGHDPVQLQFSARGDLDALKLDIAGKAPEPVSLALRLKNGAGTPTWTLSTQSTGLQPALFGAAEGEAIGFRLQANGVGGEATLEGEVSQGDMRIGIVPSKLSLADGRLRAQPLQLALAQGQVRITGDAQLEGKSPRFDVVVASDGLRFEPASAEPGAIAVQASGELKAQGRFDDWTLAGDTVLVRGDDQATLTLAGHGDRESLTLDTVQAQTPTGSLDGKAMLRWSPATAFELEAELGGFDPGYFLPDYPGAVSGQLQARGERSEAGIWRGHAQLERLAGKLRGRPISGRAEADWDGKRGHGEANLKLGDSVIEVAGDFGDRYDLQATFAPLELSDLLPEAGGRLRGSLALRGPAAALDYSARLEGSALAWNGYSAQSLTLTGSLPARGSAGSFEARAQDLQLGGLALARLDVEGSGNRTDLQLRASAAGDSGELTLAASLGRRGLDWQGRIDTLRLAPQRGPVLVLQSAADFRYGPDVLQLDRSCLVAADPGGRLCLAANGRDLTLDGDNLPLALAQPWLPVDTATPLYAEGMLDLQATLRRDRAGDWRGEGELRSASGSLRLEPDAPREVFGYRDLLLRLALTADGINGKLDAKLASEGHVSATLRGGLDASSPLTGELQLDVQDLTWLELFSEDIAAPVGRLQGKLTIAGTRAAPAISGQARLAGFRAELPGLGLKLAEGEFTLDGAPDGSARLAGSVRSGDGVLRLDGSLNFRDQATPLRLVLQGENVTLASTAEFHAVASPDLVLRYLEGRLEVRGSVVVPSARLDLESLDSSVKVSPDVVVVDPVDGPAEKAMPLDLDFSITLGEDVTLKGFGLDGRMQGTLALRERPGRAATANGTLDVTGSYRAYGQALQIERARLGYANTPFDNPTLDIRAQREFDEVTVGVQVRGTARRPETKIVSSPAMETSEALAWLVFGRPLSTTSGNESQQLGAAALALGAGGNLVAQQIGAKLGLDEAGVTDSRNLGGATFTVGKYVSPRLFLSYGISLVGTGQVVTLKYLLRRGFDISIEQGNESAASLNWRTER